MLQAPDYTQNLLAAEPLDRSQGVLEGEIGNGTGTMVVGGSLEIVFEALAGLRIVVTCGEPDALLYDFNAILNRNLALITAECNGKLRSTPAT